jgi:hypothetical protein
MPWVGAAWREDRAARSNFPRLQAQRVGVTDNALAYKGFSFGLLYVSKVAGWAFGAY